MAAQVMVIGTVVAALLHSACTWFSLIQRGRGARRPPSADTFCPDPWLPVSILIPAWREASGLMATLQALNAVRYPGEFDIIVIAGGEDQTFEIAEMFVKTHAQHQTRILRQTPGGKNAALSLGLTAATREIIVVVDADTLVEPDWLVNLVRPLHEGAAASCGNYFPRHTSWVSQYEQLEKIIKYQIDGDVVLQGSGTIAIHRAVLEQVGGFPEHIKVGVDWDLDHRVQQHGYMKVFAANARVTTHRPSSLKEFWKNEVRWRRAHLQFVWRSVIRTASPLRTIVHSSQFYLVAVAFFAALFISVSVWLTGPVELAVPLTLLAGAFVLWIALRKAAVVAEAAAYTGEFAPYRLIWVPPTLLLISFVASAYALITARRQLVHFKGERR